MLETVRHAVMAANWGVDVAPLFSNMAMVCDLYA
jgi:hypothetical protein